MLLRLAWAVGSVYSPSLYPPLFVASLSVLWPQCLFPSILSLKRELWGGHKLIILMNEIGAFTEEAPDGPGEIAHLSKLPC